MITILFLFSVKIPNLVEICVKNIKDSDCRIADAWTMVLSNISRSTDLAEIVFSQLKGHIEELVNVFSRIDFNKHNCHLNYIGKAFLNQPYCQLTFHNTNES